ncbi:MAG: hypothetical protein V5A85_04430 [Haloarculaceae archaeon]
MDDEVTRVEAVRYLEGAAGHGVASTLFLLAAGPLLYLGEWGGGVVAVLVAFGVAVNGFSIYAWDRLRELLRPAVERDGELTDRSLTPYRPSTEMRTELLSGLIMVGGFALLLRVGLLALDLFGPRRTVYFAVGGLGAGNLGALWWTYHTSSGG